MGLQFLDSVHEKLRWSQHILQVFDGQKLLDLHPWVANHQLLAVADDERMTIDGELIVGIKLLESQVVSVLARYTLLHLLTIRTLRTLQTLYTLQQDSSHRN